MQHLTSPLRGVIDDAHRRAKTLDEAPEYTEICVRAAEQRVRAYRIAGEVRRLLEDRAELLADVIVLAGSQPPARDSANHRRIAELSDLVRATKLLQETGRQLTAAVEDLL